MIEEQKIDEKEKGKIVQIEDFLIIFTHTRLIRLVIYMWCDAIKYKALICLSASIIARV